MNLVFMVSCEMTRSEFSVYIKIKIQSFQSKDIESRLHQVLAEASFNFSQMMMLILIYPEQALQSKHEEKLPVSLISQIMKTVCKVTKIAGEEQNTI